MLGPIWGFRPLVVITGNFLQAMSGVLAGGDGLEKLLKRGLDEDLINEFDVSGDGEVDKGEWLRAFLVAMDKVDGDLCDIILEQFDILDVSKDGSLSTEDILLATNINKKGAAEENQRRTGKLLNRAHARAKTGPPGAGGPNGWRLGIQTHSPGSHPHETYYK